MGVFFFPPFFGYKVAWDIFPILPQKKKAYEHATNTFQGVAIRP